MLASLSYPGQVFCQNNEETKEYRKQNCLQNMLTKNWVMKDNGRKEVRKVTETMFIFYLRKKPMVKEQGNDERKKDPTSHLILHSSQMSLWLLSFFKTHGRKWSIVNFPESNTLSGQLYSALLSKQLCFLRATCSLTLS